MASLGSLIVRVAADIGLFDKQMSRAAVIAEKRMAVVSGAINKALGVLTGGVAAGGLAVLVKNSIESADRLGKVSQQLGISTERMSGYQYAAKLANVDSEALNKSLGFLAQNISNASLNVKSEAATAFKALGVSLKDAEGRARSVDAVFEDVATAFSRAGDSAAKVDIAKALFGKEGQKLIPLLNEGAKGFADMQAEAESLGIVISSKTAQQAAEFNDEMTRIGVGVQGAATGMASGLMPALQQVASGFQITGKQGETFVHIGEIMGNVLKLLANGASIVGAVFKIVGQRIGATFAAIVAAIHRDFKGAAEIMKSSFEDNAQAVRDATAQIAETWIGSEAHLTEVLSKEAEKRKKVFLDQALARAKAAQAAAEAADKERKAEEALTKSLRSEVIGALNDSGDPWDKYTERIKKANEAMSHHAINAQEYAAAIEAAQNELDDVLGKKTSSQLSEFAVQAQRNIQGLTADLIRGKSDAKSFGSAVVQALADIASQLLAQRILESIFGQQDKNGVYTGGLFSGFINSFIGHHASGGFMGAGALSEVNERGPEMLSVGGRDFLMMGGMAGNITPVAPAAASGGAPKVEIRIDARGADPASAANIMRAAQQIARAQTAKLAEGMRRGYAPVGAR